MKSALLIQARASREKLLLVEESLREAEIANEDAFRKISNAILVVHHMEKALAAIIDNEALAEKSEKK